MTSAMVTLRIVFLYISRGISRKEEKKYVFLHLFDNYFSVYVLFRFHVSTQRLGQAKSYLKSKRVCYQIKKKKTTNVRVEVSGERGLESTG